MPALLLMGSQMLDRPGARVAGALRRPSEAAGADADTREAAE